MLARLKNLYLFTLLLIPGLSYAGNDSFYYQQEMAYAQTFPTGADIAIPYERFYLSESYSAERILLANELPDYVGIKGKSFLNYVQSMPENEQKKFVLKLLQGMEDGKYLEPIVNTADRSIIPGIKPEILFKDATGENIKLKKLSTAELTLLLYKFVQLCPSNEPFSFLTRRTREKIFTGKLPGMPIERVIDMLQRSQLTPMLSDHKANFTSFSTNAEGAVIVKTTHIPSYRGFLSLLRQMVPQDGKVIKDIFAAAEMADSSTTSSIPTETTQMRPSQLKISVKYTSESVGLEENAKRLEFYKAMQAKMFLENIGSIEKWNEFFLRPSAETFAILAGNEMVDVVQDLGHNKKQFSLPNLPLDYYSQLKFERSFIPRLIKEDWEGLGHSSAWPLVPAEWNQPEQGKAVLAMINSLAAKYSIPQGTVAKFIQVINETNPGLPTSMMLIPLWNWEQAPFLGAKKSAFIAGLGKDLIEFVASKKKMDWKDYSNLLKEWNEVARLELDLKTYTSSNMDHYNVRPDRYPVKDGDRDINLIDMGIEFTAGLPVGEAYSYLPSKKVPFLPKSMQMDGGIGSKVWAETRIGLTRAERESVIGQTAASLQVHVGGSAAVEDMPKKVVSAAAHGHGLGVSFFAVDEADRRWRVEWDGIQRSYDQTGHVVPNSGRGGLIELVTPKFNPSILDIENVYRTFRENNLVPEPHRGGGHINVDLQPFEEQPDKLGRFLSLIHNYRATMAIMFQSRQRVRNAEPVDVSQDLHNQLSTFSGSALELKKLLYNSHYFNPRVGRKTRYLQVDLTSFFQDVIPKEFIHSDYDIANPLVPWRKQFRVDPKVRKMEMRMMDAAENPMMEALQLKLVRALLNRAFNSEAPISPKIQKLNYRVYAEDPNFGYLQLKLLTDDLGLNFSEYAPLMAERILRLKGDIAQGTYRSFKSKIKEETFPKMEDWSVALDEARPAAAGINFCEHEWEAGSAILDPEMGAVLKQAAEEGSFLKKIDEKRVKYVVERAEKEAKLKSKKHLYRNTKRVDLTRF